MARRDVINNSVLVREEEHQELLNELHSKIDLGRKAMTLKDNPGWLELKTAIEQKIEIAKDSLVSCSPEAVGGLQGGVQSLKWVLNLVKSWTDEGIESQEELLNLKKQ